LTVQGQSQTVFDTGTPIDRLGLQPVSGTILNPPNAIFTSSGTAAGANTLTNTVVPNSPYSLQVNQQGIFSPTEPGNIIGIGFFLQNSVLFNLTGRAIAYTPNFVTDIDIPTTPSTPLSVGSSSVPLGLAGIISGSGGVTITNSGSATLSGANTYTGATNVAGGYLALVGPGTIASSRRERLANSLSASAAIAGYQLISTLCRSRQNRLVGIRNEACIIGESPPDPFRQTGFESHPLTSEPIVSAPMHPWWALWKWHRQLGLTIQLKAEFARLKVGSALRA
jgi:autotransporter-associated beta strand protein